MSAVKATEVARGRWQLSGIARVDPCGCRWWRADRQDAGRPVATCPRHRGYDRRPLHPWVPVT